MVAISEHLFWLKEPISIWQHTSAAPANDFAIVKLSTRQFTCRLSREAKMFAW